MRVDGRGRRKRKEEAGPSRDPELPDRAWKVLDMVNTRIEHADVKAGAILGACGILAAVIVGLMTARQDSGIFLAVSAGVSGVFVLMSATFSCAVLWPRRLRDSSPDSLLYFDHIARTRFLEPNSYEDKLQALLADPDALSREIAKQIMATSHVAAAKYDCLDRSLVFLFGTLVSTGTTALIFAVNYRGH